MERASFDSVSTGLASRGPSLLARLRAFGRRRRLPLTIAASVGTVAVLAIVLAGKRHEFATALSGASMWVLLATALLQVVALLARSEAWHLSIEAAGGSVARRVLYRASSVQVLGGMINGQLGVAARIAALRRSSPEVSPQVPTLVAAEFPILAVEAILAALTSFTLIAPLGLPWWLPLIALAAVGTVSAGMRHLALRERPTLVAGAGGGAQPDARQPPDRLRAAWQCSRRSSATGSCCARWAWTRRSSTRSPC